MSRGHGHLQQALMMLFFANVGKALTFEEIKELTGTRERTIDEILKRHRHTMAASRAFVAAGTD
jgi:hypothetical protein